MEKKDYGHVRPIDKDTTLLSKGFTGDVDVDDLTNIHPENIEGEYLTISEDLTRMGVLKAMSEGIAKKSKLKKEIYAANFNSSIREEASKNSNYFYIGDNKIKLTENSIKEALLLDKEYQKLSMQRIEDETNFEMTSIVYWSLTEKARKLENLSYSFINKNEHGDR